MLELRRRGFSFFSIPVGLVRVVRRRSHPPPLGQDDVQLGLHVADDGVHLDVVAVVAEGVLELRADALDAVQREDDERDDGNGPPAEVVDHGEGQHAAVEREDLFLVDSADVVYH